MRCVRVYLCGRSCQEHEPRCYQKITVVGDLLTHAVSTAAQILADGSVQYSRIHEFPQASQDGLLLDCFSSATVDGGFLSRNTLAGLRLRGGRCS